MPNLVSTTRPSLQILGKTQTVVFPISGFLGNPLSKKIVIIPEPVKILTSNLNQQLNLTTETKQRQKNLPLTSLSSSGFLVNLKQSRDRIPDTESAKFMFTVTVTYCRTKTENRTKKPLTQLSHYCFE